jgi:hypothetical protein
MLEVYEDEVYCFKDENLCASLGKFSHNAEGGGKVYLLNL